MQLRNKKILLGVCGSIAAYKIAHLVRLLIKSEAEVKVVMTPSASDFITPLTLSTLSRNPVDTQFVKNQRGEWTNHVELALWADYILIAPATANTIAKLANGVCDNLLCAVVLSARCPIGIAPAMDLDMLTHPSTQKNINTLVTYKYQMINTNFGELASGLIGEGRMAEPEELWRYIVTQFETKNKFTGKTVLITAGPTKEPIDPVRYISNHSTGKMGYAVAKALAEMGAKVFLISGSVNIKINHPNIHLINVLTAQDMYDAAMAHYTKADIIILAAAVADYTPAKVSNEKIKKKENEFTLDLVKTKDIAKELGLLKSKQQLLVGFALETNNEFANAKAKLKAKNFDLIVLNSMQDEGAGFGFDTNKVTIIDKEEQVFLFEKKNKDQVALDILEKIYFRLENK